ncbi:M20/M25/M40 family metallo-hydrolase [Tuwongella immobilis]|uniref:M20/M25/M40 family metallo-hydrolase n=1 Tax=Tuwongella immobilis TaxID=692036 RepID=UPI0013A6DB18
MALDTEAAIDRLMHFLAIEGITGEEQAIATAIRQSLLDLGVPESAIRFDTANERIPLPTQTGNLIVELPGTRDDEPRLLFSTHMDTVPLARGAVPVRKGSRIVPQGETALGGDNRTGVAVLVTLVAELFKQKLPHPPITLLFTVREESGLFGARYLEKADLGDDLAMCFNVDGRSAAHLTIGAVGAERWEIEITGKASHAGVYPDRGISATLIAALGLTRVHEGGWFGKVEKDSKFGTSNIGTFGDAQGRAAGDATNVVTDFVKITGESRSHDARFIREISGAYKAAFHDAAEQVRDHEGKKGKVKFTSRQDYHPFKLKEDAPVVLRARAAVEAISRTPEVKTTNGGLDANWLVKHGIPTVTFGAGQNEIHTIKEFVDLAEFDSGCRLALALATMAE